MSGALAGHHHEMRLVEHEGRRALLRTPRRVEEPVDLRQLDEADVLAFARAHGFPAPRVLARAGDTLTLEYVDGRTLHETHPYRGPLPRGVPTRLARQMRALHALDPAPLARRARPLAPEGDSAAFFEALRAFAAPLAARLWARHEPAMRALRVPPDLVARLPAPQGRRAFALCHGDVQRKNVVLTPRGWGRPPRPTWIDWELALVGDPLYDVAVHLHRTRYTPQQEREFLAAYGVANAEGRADVRRYLALEAAKSVVVDFDRYARRVRAGAPEAEARMLAEHFALGKLVRWRATLDAPAVDVPSAADVLALLRGEP